MPVRRAISRFCLAGGLVINLFAGGSVRDIVASKLGRANVGIELRAEPIAANIPPGNAVCPGALQPVWLQAIAGISAAS